MIKIDEAFLKEVGLQDLPNNQKGDFIAHTQEELELRVGEEMSRGLSVEQLQEFQGIMQMDRDIMLRLLAKLGDYREDPLYKKLLAKHNVSEGTMEILSEFLSIRWIQENRPDYEKVAYATVEDLKNEIIQDRQRILAA